jgi:hypothetical protein
MSTPFATTHGALAPVDKETDTEDRQLLEQKRREERINAPRLVQYFNKT